MAFSFMSICTGAIFVSVLQVGGFANPAHTWGDIDKTRRTTMLGSQRAAQLAELSL